ncbi:anaerobic ribonucleoside-triphosphate reductase activating protein [uncultured Duncaniella sp.]|uniref:anaerobic ribonucleoside-triphosphate reductase activating protein n=1 Tax=uncultured Duncaniella sp. TaxID=2768039 RepID=UPI00262F44F0|nr:anaerobic ribonucleoside-triphosphate reductase activating protein [uncultured Duncaniella sp.]
MNFAAIKDFDIANGPGIRVSLFVSGCPHHCKGCFNEETWDFSYGSPYTTYETGRIIELLKGECMSGLTILGGEPMAPENVYDVAELVQKCKTELPSTSIWLYTGYTLEDLIGRLKHYKVLQDTEKDRINGNEMKVYYGTMGVLYGIDVLVDGPFIEDKKNLRLRFRGSSNQRIINMNKTMAGLVGEQITTNVTPILMDDYM